MRSEPEKGIISKLERLLKVHSFSLERINLEESIVKFQTVNGGHKYLLSLSFIRRSNSLKIDTGIILINEQISRVIGVIRQNSNEEYYAISARLGLYINEANRDGFFNSNHTLQIDVDPISPDLAVDSLYNDYFLKGAIGFMEETSSLEKMDRLINHHALINKNEPIKKRVHFGSNRPWQILTGIIVARLVNSPDYQQLKKRYLDFAKDFKPGEVRSIDEFHRVVEYFDKQK